MAIVTQRGVRMSLATELLGLRRNRISTVATLIGGIERLATARSAIVSMSREWALNELADAVLATVAVHAVENYWGDKPLPKVRRAATSSPQRHRRTDNRHQRRL